MAAADDAVTHPALGIGAGNPIYFDMEAYTAPPAPPPAVLAFLDSWTAELHAHGYLSGVYSSAASGIADLVAQVGTGYHEPDDIWIANWNGHADAPCDPYVPAATGPATNASTSTRAATTRRRAGDGQRRQRLRRRPRPWAAVPPWPSRAKTIRSASST